MSVKAIGYAYPSSTLAMSLDRSAIGCYYIQTKRDETATLTITLAGPFDTLADAEQAASLMPEAWSRCSMRTPTE